MCGEIEEAKAAGMAVGEQRLRRATQELPHVSRSLMLRGTAFGQSFVCWSPTSGSHHAMRERCNACHALNLKTN